MAGVLVSDGRTVAVTSADGRFSLPGSGPFVFLCRPSGFRATHWYAAPSQDVEFVLEPEDQPVPFTFAQVTDLHVSHGSPDYGPGQGDATLWFTADGLCERIVTTPRVLDALLDELAECQPVPAFVVATGDLTNTGSGAELASYADSVARSTVPVRSLPGNHDHPSAADRVFPYEEPLGPRWYSFDYAGLHFAALDWFTWRLDVDRVEQEQWLRADLAAIPVGTPVVLLTHDQMSAEFFRSLPVRPVASFSGHWHTSRVVEVDGTMHYNTAPATFGGIDFAPAQYRLATWDGSALKVRTVVRGPARLSGATVRAGEVEPSPAARWSAALRGGCQQAGPVVYGTNVVAASKLEDEAGGAIEAFDLATGAARWSTRLDAAVKATPLVVGGLVVAASVTGETVCVEVDSGRERWRVPARDPLHLWVYMTPASDGRLVFVGDVGCLSALDLATGATVWSRSDLGRRENMTTLSSPAVLGDLLLVGFATQLPELWALDVATGATSWPRGQLGRNIYSGTQDELIAALPRTMTAGITPDPDGTAGYVVRLGSRVEKVNARDGAVIWSAPFWGWFNPAAPVVSGERVLAISGTGQLWCYDRSDGQVRWTRDIGRPAELGFGAYRADGAVTIASPTVVDDLVLVSTGDGRLVSLTLDDGRPVAELDLGMPVTGPLAVRDDMVFAVGVDGVLRALDLAWLDPRPVEAAAARAR